MGFLREMWDDIKPYPLRLRDWHREWQGLCDHYVMAREFGQSSADPMLIQDAHQREYLRFLARYEPSQFVRDAVFVHWEQGKSEHGGEQAWLALKLHGRAGL